VLTLREPGRDGGRGIPHKPAELYEARTVSRSVRLALGSKPPLSERRRRDSGDLAELTRREVFFYEHGIGLLSKPRRFTSDDWRISGLQGDPVTLADRVHAATAAGKEKSEVIRG
jgi:hypothetical protein